MKDIVRLPLRFCGQLLRQDLELLEEESNWFEHFVNENYIGTWSVIPLRAQAGA